MSPAFDTKYTPEQKAAVAAAYEDQGIRPLRLVLELAAAGNLKLNGTILEPFEISEGSAREAVKRLRRQRRGEQTSELAAGPHEDAVESLRKRLVNLADASMTALEGQAKRDQRTLTEPVFIGKQRELGRLVQQLDALHPKAEKRGPRPGRSTQEGKARGEQEIRRTELGAGLLADNRRGEGAQNGPASSGPVVPAPVNGGLVEPES